MNIKRFITLLSGVIILVFISTIIYKKFIKTAPKRFYQTEYPQKRDLYQIINASGLLQVKDNIKVGSLVAGTILKIFVKENDKVTRGQLLTLIDNGKSDTDVRKAQGAVDRTKAEITYEQQYYARQKALFESNQVSQDFFQKVTRDLVKLRADLIMNEAELEKQTIEYNNTKILAPDDGIVISVGITKGQKITTDLDATVLFQIADNVTQMEADLDIDESDIGQVKEGQHVRFTVGAYLDRVFKGKINNISYSPRIKHGILSYKASINIDNNHQLLRPGMTINAKINIAKCIGCLSISSQAFQITSNSMKNLAKTLNANITPLERTKKKALKKSNTGDHSVKYIWVVDGNNFIEKAMQTKTNNDNYYEVINGLSEKDKVIIDIEETDEMENLYKKMFKGNF